MCLSDSFRGMASFWKKNIKSWHSNSPDPVRYMQLFFSLDFKQLLTIGSRNGSFFFVNSRNGKIYRCKQSSSCDHTSQGAMKNPSEVAPWLKWFWNIWSFFTFSVSVSITLNQQLFSFLLILRSMKPLRPSTSWRPRESSCWVLPEILRALSTTGCSPSAETSRWVRLSWPHTQS